jgi:protein-tyrosine-phosphatase
MSSLLPRFHPIDDPYGRPAQEFARVFDLIDAGAEKLASHMHDPAANNHG